MAFKTEIEFKLPKGYIDENGDIHREGVMRLATAADEILPLREPKVQANPSYLSIILLSRVITKLGTIESITPRIIEKLFTSDIAYLQNLYQTFNAIEPLKMEVSCPSCSHKFETEVPFLGES